MKRLLPAACVASSLFLWLGAGLAAGQGKTGVHIMNNTLAECDRGITIMNVDSWGTSVKSRTFRVYRDAAVENNIVYNYTTHGIQIGQVGAEKSNDQKAEA